MASFPDPADLLVAHADFVQRLARALLGEEGADVAQQAFLRALHAPGRGLTRAFWATTVRRLVSNALRGQRRRRCHETRMAREASDATHAGPSPQQILEREEPRRRIIAAVLSLDEPFRQVVLLRFYEAMTPAQIAARLGVPGATVRTRLLRGLQRLRQRLDDAHGEDRAAWAMPLLPCLGRSVPGVMFWVMTMKKALALVAAVIALIACLVWFAPWTDAPSTPRPAAEPIAQASPSRLGEIAAPPAPPVQREPAERSVHLVVVDEAGGGVAGALVHLGRALAPWLPEGDGQRLGATSADGTLDVLATRLQNLAEDRLAVYVHHPEHRGESIEAEIVAQALAAERPLRVVLHRGFTQSFTFRMRTGEPVAGQTVVVSKTDAAEEFTTPPPGQPGTTFEAVHRAVSDERGEATFRGLGVGNYRFCVAVDPRIGVVEGRRASEGVQVPGPTVILTCDWLLAGGVVVRGDEIVTGSAKLYANQHGNSFPTPSRTIAHLLQEACPELATNAAPLAWVGFPSARLLRPPSVPWRVLLARTGWHSGETPLLSLRDGFTADVLTITADQPSAPMGEVVVEWPAHLPPIRFSLAPKPATLETVIVHVMPGQPTRLPPGSYELVPDLRGPAHLFGTPGIEVAVNALTRFRATLPENVAACEAIVTFPSGLPAPKASLNWRQFDRKGYSQLRGEREVILLPTGTVDLTITARGCDPANLRIEVAANDRVTTIRAVLHGAR